MSKDTEVKGTQCQRVERHGGEGNPTPRCQMARRRKEANGKVSNDAEVERTQCQGVERHGGEGNPTPNVSSDAEARGPNAHVSNDAEAKGTSFGWSRAAWLCSSYHDDDSHPITGWERHDEQHQPNGRVGNPTARRTTPLWGGSTFFSYVF